MRKIFYIFITSLISIACTDSIDEWGSGTIALTAEVDYDTHSRNLWKGASVANMEATVWFNTEIGVYPDNQSPTPPTYLPYRANVKYATNGPTTIYVAGNTNQVLAYPTDNSPVYCVGFYPQDGWTTTDNTNEVATHSINGTEDLMFAAENHGTWGEPFEVQTYRHLLTWLTIIVHATDVDAANSWGDIESLSVVNPNSSVNVEMGGTGAISYVGNPNVVPESAPLVGDLSIVANHLGDVLCAPAVTYKLKVKTVNTAEKEIEITLKNEHGGALTDPAYAIGKQFIVNLYFNSFNDISAMCSLIPWNEENMDLNGN